MIIAMTALRPMEEASRDPDRASVHRTFFRNGILRKT